MTSRFSGGEESFVTVDNLERLLKPFLTFTYHFLNPHNVQDTYLLN